MSNTIEKGDHWVAKKLQLAVGAQARRLVFSPHRPIYREGSVATEAFLLEQGLIRLGHGGKYETKSTTLLVGAPALFGDIELFGPPTREQSAVALTQVRVVAVPYATLSKLINQDVDLCQYLMRDLARRSQWTMQLLRANVETSVEERLAGVLLSLWSWAQKCGSEILMLTQEDFSAITGGSLRGVAAAMNRFMKEGAVVRRPNGYSVVLPDRLVAAAGPTRAHDVHQFIERRRAVTGAFPQGVPAEVLRRLPQDRRVAQP